MNSKQDCQLAEYFKSRRIWLLEVDGKSINAKTRALSDEPMQMNETIRQLTNYNPLPVQSIDITAVGDRPQVVHIPKRQLLRYFLTLAFVLWE